MNDRRFFLTQLGSGLVTATAGLATYKLRQDSEVVIATDMKTISLTPEQESALTILLNIELRNRGFPDDYRKMLDGIFVQLGKPRHHESMVRAGILESVEIDGVHS